ncbi:hypothetical protein [Moraxella cuniculi]|uniref:Uncharacterized protein n=1 Tax=Moraxella cuniculi TaxID=34061 RepID=A0A3S4UV52_9GAMM|nr:hypothetical protein [Moraxella cuniculi]VEG13740.1 Uncharacterised protein [Moraxella cuniculi]
MNNFMYVCYLSCFDHWLTEAEADDCQILTFDIAKDNKKIDEYLKGEKRFLSFYTEISDFVEDVKTGNVFKTISKNFQKILLNSLREKSLKEIYYHEKKILVKGGYDRTDLIFIPNQDVLNDIQRLAQKNNLFIIEIIDYNDYLADYDD